MRVTKRKQRNVYPPHYEICVNGITIGHAHGSNEGAGWYVSSEYFSVPRLNSWAAQLRYDSLDSAVEGALAYVKRHARCTPASTDTKPAADPDRT